MGLPAIKPIQRVMGVFVCIVIIHMWPYSVQQQRTKRLSRKLHTVGGKRLITHTSIIPQRVLQKHNDFQCE